MGYLKRLHNDCQEQAQQSELANEYPGNIEQKRAVISRRANRAAHHHSFVNKQDVLGVVPVIATHIFRATNIPEHNFFPVLKGENLQGAVPFNVLHVAQDVLVLICHG